jgi:hypothetical protein
MTEEGQSDSMAGCLLQLMWKLFGPGLLLAMGAILIVNQPALGTWPDYAFAGLAIFVALARIVDRMAPSATSEGGKDTAASNRLRYVGILAAIVLLIFVIAHFVAPKIS